MAVKSSFARLKSAILVAAALVATALLSQSPASAKDLSLYFVGCAAPTGFHGYLARGAEEAGKNLGFVPAYLPADEFGKLIASDDARLTEVMADLGLKKQ